MPTEQERNVAPMRNAQDKKAIEKYETLQAGLKDMLLFGIPITPANICKHTGLSKSYLYQNEKAKALIEEYKNKPALEASGFSPSYVQYSEVKRKLAESYNLMGQMLREENKRLEDEIEQTKDEIKKYKKKPVFQLHIIPSEKITGSYTYTLEEKYTQSKISPFSDGESYIEEVLWGKYIFSSKRYSFSLLNPTTGITLKEKADAYILNIDDVLTEGFTIDILIDLKGN